MASIVRQKYQHKETNRVAQPRKRQVTNKMIKSGPVFRWKGARYNKVKIKTNEAKNLTNLPIQLLILKNVTTATSNQ